MTPLRAVPLGIDCCCSCCCTVFLYGRPPPHIGGASWLEQVDAPQPRLNRGTGIPYLLATRREALPDNRATARRGVVAHRRAQSAYRVGMEEMARELGMSVSSFHHHFKQVTSMSPLQFQKQLRLQEARCLMLGEDLDATSAGERVGYDDTSHFNREYKSLFGVPPRRDVERLRAATWQNRVQAR